jgi:hypothetical protein
VNDAAAVGVGKRISDGGAYSGDFGFGQDTFTENARFQRLAFNELHGEVVTPIGVSNIKPGDDVGMVELGGHTRFADKTLHEFSVLSQISFEYLERDDSVKRSLAGLIDGTHSPRAKLSEELEVTDLCGKFHMFPMRSSE